MREHLLEESIRQLLPHDNVPLMEECKVFRSLPQPARALFPSPLRTRQHRVSAVEWWLCPSRQGAALRKPRRNAAAGRARRCCCCATSVAIAAAQRELLSPPRASGSRSDT